MKIYRYRPISNLLFKELLYQEIYLASYLELNDPLDMAVLLDFRAANLDEARTLAWFVCNRIFRHEVELAVRSDNAHRDLPSLSESMRLKRNELATEILHEISEIGEQRTIDLDRLFGVFEAICARRANDFPFLRHLDAAKKSIEASISVFFNNSHVACFAEDADNFLMWSHYADRHRGICLEFDLPRLSDSACEITMEMWGRPVIVSSDSPYECVADVGRFHQTMRKVDYVEKFDPIRFYEFLPVFQHEGDVDLHELTKSWWHPFAARLEAAFLQKNTRWASEKEWRIVDVKFKKHNLPEHRVYRYDIGTLTGVIFGCDAAEEVKNRIGEIVRDNSGDTVLYNAQLSEEGQIAIVEAAQDSSSSPPHRNGN